MSKVVFTPALLRSEELIQRLTEVTGANAVERVLIEDVVEYLAGILENTSSVTPPLATLMGYDNEDSVDARDGYAGQMLVDIARKAVAEGYNICWSNHIQLIVSSNKYPGITGTKKFLRLRESPAGSIVIATRVDYWGEVIEELGHIAENGGEGNCTSLEEAWSHVQGQLT